MPLLLAPADQMAHIRATIDGHRHWMFVADCAEARVVIGGLAMLLVLGGATDADLGLGSIQFIHPPTRTNVDVSFLTVPKSILPVASVREFLAPFKTGPITDETDLFPIGNDPELAMGCIDTIRRGKAYPVGEALGN